MTKVWAGWGDDVATTPEQMYDRAPHAAWPEPPTLRHIAAFSACAWCSRSLSPRLRCTTDPEALSAASEDDLRTGRVSGCVVDVDDRIEALLTQRSLSSPRTQQRERRPGLLARLRRTR